MLEKNRQKKSVPHGVKLSWVYALLVSKRKQYMTARRRKMILAPKSTEIRASRPEMGGFNFTQKLGMANLFRASWSQLTFDAKKMRPQRAQNLAD